MYNEKYYIFSLWMSVKWFSPLFLFYVYYLYSHHTEQFSNFKLKSFHSFHPDFNHLYFHLDIIQHDIIYKYWKPWGDYNVGDVNNIYASIVEPDTFQLKYVTITLVGMRSKYVTMIRLILIFFYRVCGFLYLLFRCIFALDNSVRHISISKYVISQWCISLFISVPER